MSRKLIPLPKIKLVRILTGCGLVDARLLLDALEQYDPAKHTLQNVHELAANVRHEFDYTKRYAVKGL